MRRLLSCWIIGIGFLIILNFEELRGSDVFEAFLTRFNCYGTEQPGCNKEFTDAYTNVSRSTDNLTRADTHYFLFTPRNKKVPELLHKCAGQPPPDTKFNPKCRVLIIIPGFVSGICNMAIFRELKNLILQRGCYNIILVDYMWGNNFDIQATILNSIIVADQTAIVVNLMKDRFNLTHTSFTCIGHSVGASVCGMLGNRTHIRCITGMDPPGIIYAKLNPYHKLNPGDADYVQAMHCNAGQCLPDIGGNYSAGHIDFWINGGIRQPACVIDRFEAFDKGDLIYASLNFYPSACSHFECLQYYRASILPDPDCLFIGVKCKSQEKFNSGKCNSCGPKGCKCAVMGFDFCDCIKDNQIKCPKPQNYYLNTSLLCPYCNISNLNLEGFHCDLKRTYPVPESHEKKCSKKCKTKSEHLSHY